MDGETYDCEAPPPEKADQRQTPPFELPEYQRAFLKFTREAIEGFSSAKDPMLGRMRKRRPERTYLGRNSLPQGQVHEATPMPVRSEFSLTAMEILEGNSNVLGRKLEELTEGYLASLMPQVFSAISAATEAAGTSLSAEGKPFSADMFIEMLERMEVEFDEAGQIQLQIVTGPDTVIPELSQDDERRVNEVIDRKREEFFAKRRSRKLSRHPLGG
jgi:hypothetical protein